MGWARSAPPQLHHRAPLQVDLRPPANYSGSGKRGVRSTWDSSASSVATLQVAAYRRQPDTGRARSRVASASAS